MAEPGYCLSEPNKCDRTQVPAHRCQSRTGSYRRMTGCKQMQLVGSGKQLAAGNQVHAVGSWAAVEAPVEDRVCQNCTENHWMTHDPENTETSKLISKYYSVVSAHWLTT